MYALCLCRSAGVHGVFSLPWELPSNPLLRGARGYDCNGSGSMHLTARDVCGLA
jgi:hypothetical protein